MKNEFFVYLGDEHVATVRCGSFAQVGSRLSSDLMGRTSVAERLRVVGAHTVTGLYQTEPGKYRNVAWVD